MVSFAYHEMKTANANNEEVCNGFDRAKAGEKGTEEGGFEPFYVEGRDVERSVVTGRTGGRSCGMKGWEGLWGGGGGGGRFS